jgi:hypothetical protein
MVTMLLEALITQHCKHHHANLCVGRDVIHNIAFKANWDQLQKKKTGHFKYIQSKRKQEQQLNSL